jgi:hypothetical protein
MNTVQALSLFSGDTSEPEVFNFELAVVCLWSVVGLLLTMLALGFGAEIGQALAVAG